MTEQVGFPVVTKIEDTRIIYINGEVSDAMAYAFNIFLLQLEHEDPEEDITVYINSPGGSVLAGMSMIDTMNLISCDVSTVCVGLAASMGAMLLMSGKKGKRKILPHSEVLIHQPLGGVGYGQATDIEIRANHLIETKKKLYHIMAEATGQPYERIEKDCERDHILDAEAALEYGIVDEILRGHDR